MPPKARRRLSPHAISKVSSRVRKLRQANNILRVGIPAAVACSYCINNKHICYIMASLGAKCEVCTRLSKDCSFRPLDELREEYEASQAELRSALLDQRDILEQSRILAERLQESAKRVSVLLEKASAAKEVFRQAVIHEGQALSILDASSAAEVSEVMEGVEGEIDFNALLDLEDS